MERRKEKSKEFDMTAIGKKIHNETVLFDSARIQNADIHLVGLLETAAREEGFAFSPGKRIPKKKRYENCHDVLLYQNSGATHYIASVDLGGKVYAVETTQRETREEGTYVTLEAHVTSC